MQVEIYALQDPRDGSIRYVGSSRCARRRAWGIHTSCNAGMRKWIDELDAAGLRVTVVVLKTVAEEHAEADEGEWIVKLRAMGAPLLNVREKAYRARWRGERRLVRR